MPSPNSKAIIACAGSGKTTSLVQAALANRDRRIAIVTYTHFNMKEISARFGALNSGIPQHVDVMTWYTFLLRECARPYQRANYARRIESIQFVNDRSAKGVPKKNTARYYFNKGDCIYSDKISQFVIECNKTLSSAVTQRLAQIYTDIFIDEFQDLAGWDLEVVHMLLEAGIRVTLVGDPRQHIYSTNPSAKNKQYLGTDVISLLQKWEKRGLCSVEEMNDTYRCNAEICKFSNALWPELVQMLPKHEETTGHDGVFLVSSKFVHEYLVTFRPQLLRYNRLSESYGAEAMNFGLAKGLQFDRVLIVPTAPIKKYLATGTLGKKPVYRDRLHVAVTRARHSVAFVYDGTSPVVAARWQP